MEQSAPLAMSSPSNLYPQNIASRFLQTAKIVTIVSVGNRIRNSRGLWYETIVARSGIAETMPQMSTQQHIAVVDDEEQIRAVVGEYLELHGFRVSLADGGESLRKIMAGRDPIDLVILDLNMPGEDGLTIARRLREHSSVGIVILTAAGQTIDRVVGLEIGADDYITKPFDLRELLARVKSVLRRVAAPPAAAPEMRDTAAIRFGHLILDTESHTLVDSDGKEIPLTSMEYDLLRAFANAPNRVLNREQLLDMAHDRNTDPFDRSIDVRIARIRRKIEKDPSKPQVIKTIRGAGYKFLPDAEG